MALHYRKCCTTTKERGLKRELGLFQATISGVGIILGAGIYTLIGIATGSAGNAVWLAFFLSSLIAVFTGISYAELSSMYKNDSGEYQYTEEAFGKRLAKTIGLMIITTGVVSSATVALGFGGYLSSLIGKPILISALLLILILSMVNFKGIKESVLLNTIFTMIEAVGLFIVIILAVKSLGSVDYMEMPRGFSGVFRATALIFFAYMGFENIVKLSEETKKPEKTIPKAIILSIIISTIIYVLVALAAVSILDWNLLAGSKAPLADVAAVSFGKTAFIVLAVIALFSTTNTVLMTMVTTSRMIYGMAKEGSLPKHFSEVHKKTRTPYKAVILVMLATMIFSTFGDIEVVANITNLFLFSTFTIVNLDVIRLRYKKPKARRVFNIPVNIGKMPLLSLLGVLSSCYMLIFVIINLIG